MDKIKDCLGSFERSIEGVNSVPSGTRVCVTSSANPLVSGGELIPWLTRSLS